MRTLSIILWSMLKTSYATWLEVDLQAIRHNIEKIQSLTNVSVMAVVKANAYGHGLINVARTVRKMGLEWLGVARIDEALLLRDKGINGKILVLGHTDPIDVPLAVRHHISLAVHSQSLVLPYQEMASHYDEKLMVHAKIDTGMSRLGEEYTQAVQFIRSLFDCEGLQVEGVFTHMARADELSLDTTDIQIEKFDKILEDLGPEREKIKWIHAANSAAAVFHPNTRFNMVRPGISIYGLNPSEEAPLPTGFEPALSWKSVITSVKTVPPHRGISYGHRYITSNYEKIGTISVGYGDGYRRVPGNEVLVNGRKVPVLGNVCMDQCVISLNGLPDVKTGDEVVLLGKQGDQEISAETLAKKWNTIVYEPICGLTGRIPRVYLNE